MINRRRRPKGMVQTSPSPTDGPAQENCGIEVEDMQQMALKANLRRIANAEGFEIMKVAR